MILILTLSFQALHAVKGNGTWGVDGDTGKLVDMKEFGVWEPLCVKVQVLKTAIEVCVCVCVCVYVHVCQCSHQHLKNCPDILKLDWGMH